MPEILCEYLEGFKRDIVGETERKAWENGKEELAAKELDEKNKVAVTDHVLESVISVFLTFGYHGPSAHFFVFLDYFPNFD